MNRSVARLRTEHSGPWTAAPVQGSTSIINLMSEDSSFIMVTGKFLDGRDVVLTHGESGDGLTTGESSDEVYYFRGKRGKPCRVLRAR